DIKELLEETRFGFTEAMNDDFNSRAAIEEIFQLVRSTNKAMGEKTISAGSAAKAVMLLEEFDTILGVLPKDDNSADNETLDSVMDILIELRKELRSRKQYDLADIIRNKLGEAGIVLEDTSEGAKWKKT
ncbi:MAG: cysteine--tRNA ligase, partial [Candidatus Methanoplasma sp.]|nr:cysteine--tRNA ligase [Candidatus Methanoplasma sp.]